MTDNEKAFRMLKLKKLREIAAKGEELKMEKLIRNHKRSIKAMREVGAVHLVVEKSEKSEEKIPIEVIKDYLKHNRKSRFTPEQIAKKKELLDGIRQLLEIRSKLLGLDGKTENDESVNLF